jgi:hypothetical protein
MKAPRLFLATLFLAIPQTAIACARCGEGDELRADKVTPSSYYDGVLQSLRFGPGSIRDNGFDDLWEVSAISRSGDEYVLHSEAGEFRFKLQGTPQYRQVDITFITKPNADPSEMYDIYYEVQLDGVLALPALLAESFGRDSIEATILLQGVENACFDARALQRWLFRAEFDREIWRGSGKLIQPAR